MVSLLMIVQSVSCGNDCRCHYNTIQRSNVFFCSGSKYTRLPARIPTHTNTIEFENTSISQLCGNYSYFFKQNLTNVTSLSLHSGKLNSICDETLNEIILFSNVTSLNLVQNKMTHIPILFNKTQGNLTRLWLGGNPVVCDCNMLWLISWLNSTRVSDQRLVQDYTDVICTGGDFDGTPVYKLDKVKMGCYPEKVATWIIFVSCISGGLLLLSVIITLIIHRKWNAVRWIVYKNFDKLLGEPDRNEDIESTEFDAFLSYW